MQKFLTRLRDLLHEDKGVSSIEYALLGILIAMAIIGSVVTLSDTLKSTYQLIAARMP
ncbi:Flp family type IVb pilin [Cupriavidus sp. CP313]